MLMLNMPTFERTPEEDLVKISIQRAFAN